ncbi:MAG TPA: hypothetical protein PKD28_02345, partial [Candidatus Saccharibacteria bacterium]|nr:hypothetical protein [Candidatus Saccharibacteria bacterium]
MLQQCINLISAPNTGVGESNIVMALLPYILVIAAFALIFGVHLWRSNRFARRSAAHRPGRAGLLSLFAVASLAIGGLALTAQAFAQQIPIECQQYTTDDGSGGNDGSAPSEPTTMQSMTTDYCQNHMDTYTGSNEDSILSLTDSRGGIA